MHLPHFTKPNNSPSKRPKLNGFVSLIVVNFHDRHSLNNHGFLGMLGILAIDFCRIIRPEQHSLARGRSRNFTLLRGALMEDDIF